MTETPKPVQYLAARYLEVICISLFIFGFLWNGTEVMNMSTPQFFMLYGGAGAVICEVLSRLFSKKKNGEKGGNKKWITVTLVIGLVLAFVMGLLVLRQTHAIWGMTSSNAMTVNTTMNVAFGLNPLAEVLVLVLILAGVLMLFMHFGRMGFG